MRSFMALFSAPLLFALFLTPSARAGDKVYSPIIEEGELEIEARLLFGTDRHPDRDGAQNHVFEIGYGFTPRWASAVLVEVERTPGEPAKATHVSFENIVTLLPQGKYWLDLGGYVEFEKGVNGDANEIETRLLVEKQAGRWTVTTNAIFTKNISGDEGLGTKFGYNWRTKYRLTRSFELGVEGYGNIGRLTNADALVDQYHTIGPAVLGKVNLFGPRTGALRYDISYLRGLTNGAPASNFQLNLEYELRF